MKKPDTTTIVYFDFKDGKPIEIKRVKKDKRKAKNQQKEKKK